jgi:hypothetical protein
MLLGFEGYDSVSATNIDFNNYTGRISSMLTPISSSFESMSNMTMREDNSMTNRTTMQDQQSRMEAMRFSMAQDVTWLLSGDWNLLWSPSNTTAATTESNTTEPIFQAEFTKITTNGTMKHFHKISDFNASSNFLSDPYVKKLSGSADIYFNDELAWPNSNMNITILSDEVLRIDVASEDIDNHFHGQPIYGIVSG